MTEKGQSDLLGLLAKKGAASRGRVHIIDIEPVKTELGSRWQELSDRVYMTANRVIEQRCQPDDLFFRYDETTFVIAFGSLDEARAKIKTTLIAHEIAQRLMGAKPPEEVVNVKSVELDTDGGLRLGKSDVSDLLVKEVSEAPPIGTPKRQDEAQQLAVGNIDFIFRPFWFVQKRVISNYVCIPVLATTPGHFRSGYDVLTNPSEPYNLFCLDLLTLKRSVREIKAARTKKTAPLISVPVNFETLAAQRWREKYLKWCRDTIIENDRHLVFELVGLPDGIPLNRIQELVEALKPFARTVLGRFDLSHREFEFFRTAGLHAVGVDLYLEQRREKKLMTELDLFVAKANEAHLRTYAHGVRSISLNTAAICSGVDYVDGYAITSVQEAALDIEFYDIRTPYEKLIS